MIRRKMPRFAECGRVSVGTRALCGGLVLLVAWSPATSGANVAAVDSGAGEPEDAGEPDLGEMWRQAQVRLETSDYLGAIEGLTALYQRIAQDPEAKALRLRVRWTLHEAHLGAYALERDAKHLRVARELLVGYLGDLAETETELREEGEAALAAVEDEIARHERAEEAARAEAERAAAEQAERERIEREQAERERASRAAQMHELADAPPPSADRSARPLVISGAVLTGSSAVGIAMAIGGFASANRQVRVFEQEPERRDEARDKVKVGNAVGIGGAIVGGVLLTTGAALLAVGRKRSTPRVSANVGPDGFGVSWTGRF